MKRVRKLSDAAKAEFYLQRTLSKSKTNSQSLTSTDLSKAPPNYRFIKHIPSHTSHNQPSHVFPTLVNLFTCKKANTFEAVEKECFVSEVLELSADLVSNQSDEENISLILDDKAWDLVRKYSDGLAFVELLQKLKPWPQLALQVFCWRKEKADAGLPMTVEEYTKGITIAGRINNIDLAVMLFSEASEKGIKTSATYNALMGVYMYNMKPQKVQDLFRKMKKESTCPPTIVTYNILLTVFGRMALVPHMEATFREIEASNLTPNLNTYNHMIAGYVTAWMWDDMERVFGIMENGPIKPDVFTHSLMLRGYAHSRNLVKMEKTYNLIKLHVNDKEMPLIRAMICAYCESSDKDRVTKVETLFKLIPEEEYRPWLNVLLIRLYAQEDLLDMMESFIRQAFEHNTQVTTIHIMRAIIATYFRCNAVERFTTFLKLAEFSGWRICRSLYHCKMVMYSSLNRLEEMENVLEEMGQFNLDPTKKTFLIMYKAYLNWGQRYRLQKLLVTMCKHGHEIPVDASPS